MGVPYSLFLKEGKKQDLPPILIEKMDEGHSPSKPTGASQSHFHGLYTRLRSIYISMHGLI